MSEQYKPNVGQLITDDAYRDAIHIAIIPMTAREELNPGQHVGMINNEAYGHHPEPLGVVDPFLDRAVNPGQRFWLFLYPNTITNLRHVWTHPSFKAKTL